MRFPEIRYMRWVKEHLDTHPARFNLAGSGMQAPTASDLGLEGPFDLRLHGNNADGEPELRARVAAHYETGTDHVLLATGTSLANFLVLASLVEPGDTVLCERPIYEPLQRTLEGLGAKLSFVDRPLENGGQPDPDQVEQGFADGARLLVLTDLHNPSAARLEPSRREAMLRSAEKHGAYILFDEVYLSGVFDEKAPTAWGTSDRAIVTASLTKTYGLGALRTGWAIAPPEIVQRGLILNDHLGVEAAYVAEMIALRAFDRLPALRTRSATRRAEALPLVREAADRAGLRWFEPGGGFIVWVGLPEGIMAWDFALHLRKQYDTQITPGDHFGVPERLRLGFGGDPVATAEGLAHLELAVTDLR
ncbi:MAG: pyridoxal phosphate-dependent aminotransferase [Planctomycetota bacterium]